MKKAIAGLLILAVFAAITSPAYSRELRPIDFEYCKSQEELAEAIMEARQIGRPMSSVMDTVRKQDTISKMAILLVQMAYDSPRYSTQKAQKRAITEFSNEHYAACLKAESKGR